MIYLHEIPLISLQLYQRALSYHKGQAFPPYWHKNQALVCEKLLHLDHSLNKAQLAQESIDHFTHYIRMDPTDPDNQKISEAIAVLRERKRMLDGMQRVEETTDNMMERMEKLQKTL